MSQTFLSIGSGPGIGFATALRFGREGYDVVLSSRDTTRLAKQAEQLAAADPTWLINGKRGVIQAVGLSASLAHR